MDYGSTVTQAPLTAPKTPVTAKVYYVIFGTIAGLYLDKSGFFDGLIDAERFETMGRVLFHIGENPNLGPIEIRRVTETPSTSTKRILKLNETAPEGVKLEFVVFNGYFKDGDAMGACDLRERGTKYGRYGVDINEAPLFTSEIQATDAIRSPNGTHGLVVRRVLTESGKGSYTIETVK